MARPDKAAAVAELTERFRQSDAVVLTEYRSLSALLGASPGASASVGLVLDLLKRSFPEHYAGWLSVLRQDMPHLGVELNTDAAALANVRTYVSEHLRLDW